MTKWEYCTVGRRSAAQQYVVHYLAAASPARGRPIEGSLDQFIARLGLDGWELIGLHPAYFFKRPLSNEPPTWSPP
jgi:hypothetical protein